MTEWINITDQLPVIGQEVLTWEGEYSATGKGQGFEYMVNAESINSFALACLSGEEYDCCWSHVSHWMPLPILEKDDE